VLARTCGQRRRESKKKEFAPDERHDKTKSCRAFFLPGLAAQKFKKRRKSQVMANKNKMLNETAAVAETPQPAAPPEIQRDFLTTAELQKAVLPLSRRSILEWRKSGKIPAVVMGGKILYHRESVIAALCRRQAGGAA
jgi:hypothetical protein